MADYPIIAALPRSVRAELSRYAPEIPLTSLVVGVDNIHHDVYISPKFVEVTRTFLVRFDPPDRKTHTFSWI